jgi:hypothetical protein
MGIMADGEQSSTAILGRILSWIGYLWVVFAVLWGIGVAEAIGISGSFASSIGRSVFPAIVLIVVGRVMRKRTRVDPNDIQPDVAPGFGPTPPILPGDEPSLYLPPPIVQPAPRPPPRPAAIPKQAVPPPPESASVNVEPREEPMLQAEGVPPPHHKTSQELIDEARHRWGTRP